MAAASLLPDAASAGCEGQRQQQEHPAADHHDLGGRNATHEHLDDAILNRVDGYRGRAEADPDTFVVRVARSHGEDLLAAGLERLNQKGVAAPPSTLQRHDYLADTLHEFEPEMGVLVIGKRGDQSGARRVGSHLETEVRMLHKPILVCASDFIKPKRFLVAYDGSEGTHQGLLRVAKSMLLSGLKGEILYVGESTPTRTAQLEAAADLLRSCGSGVVTRIVSGHSEDLIPDRVHASRADLLVMGVYSHSTARRFLLGSQALHMLRHTSVTTLILRA